MTDANRFAGTTLTSMTTVLPHPLPPCENARIALFAMRRMGAQGLADARAAHLLFTAFGQNFRRPLILLRALMADLAGASAGTIAIAPCCCARMTPAESAMLTILAFSQGGSGCGSTVVMLASVVPAKRLASVIYATPWLQDQGRLFVIDSQ